MGAMAARVGIMAAVVAAVEPALTLLILVLAGMVVLHSLL
jgi:hypothetical protein